MNVHTNREMQRIRELTNEYTAKGYKVRQPRTKLDVPSFLRNEGYLPDLVVESPDENLVIEVKTSESVRQDKRISRISELVNRQPRWQFLFVLTNPKSDSLGVRAHNSERWNELLWKSRHDSLRAPELTEAAFLLAWAALEGAVRTATAAEVRSADSAHVVTKSPMSQIRDAVMLGLVDRNDLATLEALFSLRNSIVHATDGPRPSIDNVRFLQQLVDEIIRLVSDEE